MCVISLLLNIDVKDLTKKTHYTYILKIYCSLKNTLSQNKILNEVKNILKTDKYLRLEG